MLQNHMYDIHDWPHVFFGWVPNTSPIPLVFSWLKKDISQYIQQNVWAMTKTCCFLIHPFQGLNPSHLRCQTQIPLFHSLDPSDTSDVSWFLENAHLENDQRHTFIKQVDNRQYGETSKLKKIARIKNLWTKGTPSVQFLVAVFRSAPNLSIRQTENHMSVFPTLFFLPESVIHSDTKTLHSSHWTILSQPTKLVLSHCLSPFLQKKHNNTTSNSYLQLLDPLTGPRGGAKAKWGLTYPRRSASTSKASRSQLTWIRRWVWSRSQGSTFEVTIMRFPLTGHWY